jgi:hypothetical protein
VVESQLEQFMALGDDELLMAIGHLADPRAPLNNPPALIAKGEAVVTGNLERVRGIVCPRRHLLDGPEATLAAAVIGALADHLTLGLASAVAAYMARRGVLWLCGEPQ